jgi:hypothetical protein
LMGIVLLMFDLGELSMMLPMGNRGIDDRLNDSCHLSVPPSGVKVIS